MINSYDFLNQAKSILQNYSIDNPNEVELRTSISRAYYSLFHISFEYLRNQHKDILLKEITQWLLKSKKNMNYILDNDDKIKNFDRSILKDVNMHNIITNAFYSIDRHKNKGRIFKDHRDTRNDADYDLCIDFTLDNSKAIVTDIEKLIKDLK